jgi:hypothetical protein
MTMRRHGDQVAFLRSCGIDDGFMDVFVLQA